jgi:hypothetical protein
MVGWRGFLCLRASCGNLVGFDNNCFFLTCVGTPTMTLWQSSHQTCVSLCQVQSLVLLLVLLAVKLGH